MLRGTSFLLLAITVMALVVFRQGQPSIHTTVVVPPYLSEGQDKLLAAMESGRLPGLGADLTMLRIFSLFYLFTHEQSKDNHLTLRQSISRQFQVAQFLDPQFHDVYRLAEGILAYDLDMPRQAVDLLERGGEQLDQWEIPFMASFIAHDRLHDDARAVKLAKLATEKNNVPPLIFGYLSRLMAKDLGPEFAIKYLEQRKRSLPAGYQHGLDKRIQKLKEMQHENVTKP
jgi:hypothetical protein